MEILTFLPGAAVSAVLFHYFTHPNSKVKKRIPALKISRIQLTPNIRLNLLGKTIHFHHWLNLSILLAISIPAGGLLDYHFTKGFLIGGIAQGLLYPDAGRLIYKSRSRKTISN